MDYFTALRRSGKILEGYFEQSKDILHSASKGTVREAILNKVIRPFLPPCYGISGGEAFDSEGHMSKQLDLVIYDAMYSYTVPYIEGFIQFPCESVYGNIEIKSKLNQEEFEKAVENIASLKSLVRESTHSWTVTPQVQMSVNGLPGDSGRNKYFGIIFAYESTSIESIMSYAMMLGRLPSAYRPNAIVLYDKRTIIIQADEKGVNAYQEDFFHQYVALECGDDVLAVFIGLLINYTRFTLLKAANIPEETRGVLQAILDRNNQEGRALTIELPHRVITEQNGNKEELTGIEAEEQLKRMYWMTRS